MLQFSGLRYYSLPALPRKHVVPHMLTIELGLFAGRLYMEHEECMALAKYIDSDSMIKRSDVRSTRTTNFILDWVSLRRKGQDILHTPLSYVCQGRPLSVEHAVFMTNQAADGTTVIPYRKTGTVSEVYEAEDDYEEDENENQEDEEDEDENYYLGCLKELGL